MVDRDVGAQVWARSRSWWHPASGRAGKVTFILLQQVDLGLTLLAASWGIPEVNPFMRGLLSTPLQLVLVKAVIPVLMAGLIPGRLLIPAAGFLLLVVGWNIKELFLFLL
ncbi:MAG: DUF5658 family protein [Chloroflexota bacterium]